MLVGRPATGDGPRIGVAIGTVNATPEWWLESARRLEAAGYEAVWAWDQVVGRGDRTVPVVEQWTILAAAAGATSRIGLGTFVTNVGFRPPALLAKVAATLQNASGGRLTLSLGIGGGAKAAASYGLPFPAKTERIRRLEEAVSVIRLLWTGGPVSFDGERYQLAEAYAFPVPNPVPRILIGAQSPGGVRLAARIGDGWAAERPAFEAYLPAYLDGLAAAGKSRADAWIALGFGGEEKGGANALDDSPWISDPLGEWQRWHAAGADAVIVTARTQADVDRLVAAG
ncbi:MAG TPA: LLM class flavin-dependent oxidoreductase [Candidatus Limnocylindrales bacterium]|nr:LLM class flavin-dependent oxidoreductase [Candidatus Limnocylindrales bacterium]